MSCSVGCSRGSDLVLLWPAATVPIQPLAWELPYATGVALKRKTKKWAKDLNRDCPKEDTQMTNKHIERYLINNEGNANQNHNEEFLSWRSG